MFHLKHRKQNMRYGGFTLIEALVAISILLVGIVSAFGLVTKSLVTAPVIQDRLVASFLAQEGIEDVRHTRDSNFLKILNGTKDDKHWGDNITNQTDTLSRTDLYTDTDFKREITVNKLSDDHLQIQCKVSWKAKGHQYSFTAEDHLYNWINIK